MRAPRAKWRPEEELQATIVAALQVAAPDVLVFASANGAHMSPLGRQMFFGALGGLAGVHDLQCIWHGGFAFMEIKAPRRRKDGRPSTDKRYDLSDAQNAFADRLDAFGIPWARVTSVEDALDALTRWGAPVRRGVEA